MKAGLITLHYSTNYGAVLQTFYTQEYFKRLGYDIEIIDYRPFSILYFYSKHLFLNKRPITGILKLLKFTSFFKKYYNVTNTIFFKFQFHSVVSKYDVLIVGSDEVWNINSHRKFNSAYFLSFAFKNQKVFSFASSSGSFSFSRHSQNIKELLQKFDIITVRDDLTRSVLELLNVSSIRLLDPTLLLDIDFNFNCREYKNNYVLVYGTLLENEYLVIKDYAYKNNLDIVSINTQKYKVNKVYYNIGVIEWLNLIQNAKFLFTNYFHGLIFSLKFNNIVFYLSRKTKDYKAKQLVKDLFLIEEHIFSSCNSISRLTFSIDTKLSISDYRKSAFCLFSNDQN